MYPGVQVENTGIASHMQLRSFADNAVRLENCERQIDYLNQKFGISAQIEVPAFAGKNDLNKIVEDL